MRGESGLGQRLGDVRDQVRVPHLPYGHVDAHEDRRLVRVVQLPAPGLTAGGDQDPAAERHDRAVLLGQSDEPIRRQHAELRVVPAHQRLDAAQPSGLHAHQRLVLQGEFTPLDGGAERGGQRLAGHAVRVALRIEQRPAGLAVGLRPVQRRVGGLHQAGGRCAGRVPLDHADRRRQRQPLPRQVERSLQRLQHRLGQIGELVGSGRVLDEQRELVPAEPRHQR